MNELEVNGVVQFIQDVKNLLNTPGVFAQEDYAYDKYGETVDWNDPNAVKFCTVGACLKIDGEFSTTGQNMIGMAAAELYNIHDMTPPIPYVNDYHGLEAINKVLDRAKEISIGKETQKSS